MVYATTDTGPPDPRKMTIPAALRAAINDRDGKQARQELLAELASAEAEDRQALPASIRRYLGLEAEA